MLAVLVLDISLLLAGLTVLGVLGWRLWRQVRDLGTAVAAAGEQIAAATERLQDGVDSAPRS